MKVRVWCIISFLFVSLPLLAEPGVPGVPPELGGPGFEEWVKGQPGWKTATPSAVGNPEAVKGGKLRMAMVEFPSTLRIVGKDSNSTFLSAVSSLLFNSLLTLDSKTLDIAPDLATHWRISEDKMTFSFRINPEARWSDGMPVTSDDVIASWQLRVDEGILMPYTNILYGKYEEPVAESPYLVHVTTIEENWRHFLYFGISLALMPAHIIGGMDGSEYLEEFQFKSMPGTGPYGIDEDNIDTGRSVVITRHKNWWNADAPENRGLYNFDEIEWVVVMDERLHLEKFKKGELDVYAARKAAWWVNEFNFDEIQRGVVQKRKIYNEKVRGISGHALNMREMPFNDIRVRRAMAHLYNRDKLIDKLFFNEYDKNFSYFPGGVYENPDNIRYEYDPVKAQKLLAEAGWDSKNSDGWLVNNAGDVFELTLTFDSPSWERIHTVFQEDLAKAGIRLHMKQMTSATQFKNNMEHNFKIAFQSWGGLFWPNPNSSWHSLTADETPSTNICGVKDAYIDSIAKLYDEEYDQRRREELIRKIDYRLSELSPYALAWAGPFHRLVFWNKFGFPEGYVGRTGDYLAIQSLWYEDPARKKAMDAAISDPSMTLPVGETLDRYWPKRLGKN
jgi:microcin C transport system substrate-binding protein